MEEAPEHASGSHLANTDTAVAVDTECSQDDFETADS